jgi:hypothetical protein
LAFAVAARADRIEYGGSDYAAGAGADLRSQAPSTEALHSSDLLVEPGSIAFGAGGILSEWGDAERLTDYVFYSHFGGDSAKAVEGPVDSDSIRRRLDGILGDRYDGPGEYFRVGHPAPFRRALGVQAVPEPGTLLLLGAGLAVLALWKRGTIASEERFAGFF